MRAERCWTLEHLAERAGVHPVSLSRIETGSVPVTRELVALEEMARSCVAAIQGQTRGGAVEVANMVPGDLPPLRVDPVHLRKILLQLLDNAVKFGGEEPVNVYARPDGQDVLISVTDLGKGIPPAELDRVFEKFYRRGKPDGRAPGTGLGLSISRGFVEAMGGTIHAESPAVKKKGTRIVIRLPAGEKKTDEKKVDRTK